MNFVAHAALALEQREDPALALGAMLPDLASLCGARLAGVSNPRVAEGVRWHVASDAAFHDAPLFRSLVRSASRAGVARGLRRGIARAAAHVTIEIWLDASLLARPGLAGFVDRALAVAQEPAVRRAITWRRPGDAPRWRALHDRLSSRGFTRKAPTSARVADGVVRTLARRPRLSAQPGELRALHAGAEQLRGPVERSAPALLRPPRRALAQRAETVGSLLDLCERRLPCNTAR
ncbi:MAG: hypothetical protein ACE5IL_12105 [Myxococcota bacterium]